MIGVFGGTFDPVHFGHLRPALDVQQALGLDQVRFIPLAVAVHRGQPTANPSQRLAMLEAATAEQPEFLVDPREILRGDRSYTLDTLKELRAELPEETLCLCIGSDAFNDFLNWHKPLEILRLSHLVVTQRPGTLLPRDEQLRDLVAQCRCERAEELRQDRAGRIIFQPVTQLDISSTAIRSLLAEGKSPRYLLPAPVLRIITSQALYR